MVGVHSFLLFFFKWPVYWTRTILFYFSPLFSCCFSVVIHWEVLRTCVLTRIQNVPVMENPMMYLYDDRILHCTPRISIFRGRKDLIMFLLLPYIWKHSSLSRRITSLPFHFPHKKRIAICTKQPKSGCKDNQNDFSL